VVTQAAPRANYIPITLSKRWGAAHGINNLGQVVGKYETTFREGNTTTFPFHAFLWKDGVFRDIGAGKFSSEALAINNAGQVVGSTTAPEHDVRHAFIWQNGVMQNLGTAGTSVATGINAKRQVVGWNSTSRGTFRAFLWENGRTRMLTGLENVNGQAFGIDINRRVAGEFGGSNTRGFRWNGAVTPVGTFGGPTSSAKAINDEGKLVGWAATSTGSQRAFLWRNGVMTNLGTLGGNSRAYGINGVGHIVGESDVATEAGTRGRAFLWKNGVMYDVGPGSALGINQNGWIVGSRIDPATTGLLMPVPTLWKPTNSPPSPPAPGLIRVGVAFFASTRNSTYNPSVDTVAVGRTVTWSWFGGTHNVQSVGSPGFTSSREMSGGQAKYTFTFTKPGTYRYNCLRHPKTMSGRIIVR
jgi:probable HAF family extracellular repeat protein